MHCVTFLSIGLLAAIAQTQAQGKSGSDSTADNGTDTSDDSAMSSGMATSTMAAMSSGAPIMSGTAAAGEPAEPTDASLAMPSATGSSGAWDGRSMNVAVVAGAVLVGGAALV